jgi:DNA-binding PadR family transcriptional regulator
MNVVPSIVAFHEACERLVDQAGLSPEWIYRIKKIMGSIDALEDKVYLKTIKGKETLLECIEKARFLKSHSDSNDFSYRLLTDLEMTCEELLVQSYRFRIKAG